MSIEQQTLANTSSIKNRTLLTALILLLALVMTCTHGQRNMSATAAPKSLTASDQSSLDKSLAADVVVFNQVEETHTDQHQLGTEAILKDLPGFIRANARPKLQVFLTRPDSIAVTSSWNEYRSGKSIMRVRLNDKSKWQIGDDVCEVAATASPQFINMLISNNKVSRTDLIKVDTTNTKLQLMMSANTPMGTNYPVSTTHFIRAPIETDS